MRDHSIVETVTIDSLHEWDMLWLSLDPNKPWLAIDKYPGE